MAIRSETTTTFVCDSCGKEESSVNGVQPSGWLMMGSQVADKPECARKLLDDQLKAQAAQLEAEAKFAQENAEAAQKAADDAAAALASATKAAKGSSSK